MLSPVAPHCDHLPSTFLLTIPQKLSKSTESLPFNHRTTTCTSFDSLLPMHNRILKPNSASSSSTSASPTSSCCLFRLACRDHTFPIAKPTPVAMLERHCHCRSSVCSSVSILPPKMSIDVSGIVKVNSEGKGRRCFGRDGIPLARVLR